jgi:hypothetical protein
MRLPTVLALIAALLSVACGPNWNCPPGYTPVCQSGAIHGTHCVCEPPRTGLGNR